jgi:hypothetical protein
MDGALTGLLRSSVKDTQHDRADHLSIGRVGISRGDVGDPRDLRRYGEQHPSRLVRSSGRSPLLRPSKVAHSPGERIRRTSRLGCCSFGMTSAWRRSISTPHGGNRSFRYPARLVSLRLTQILAFNPNDRAKGTSVTRATADRAPENRPTELVRRH